MENENTSENQRKKRLKTFVISGQFSDCLPAGVFPVDQASHQQTHRRTASPADHGNFHRRSCTSPA
jgi:hypothetical protein